MITDTIKFYKQQNSADHKRSMSHVVASLSATVSFLQLLYGITSHLKLYQTSEAAFNINNGTKEPAMALRAQTNILHEMSWRDKSELIPFVTDQHELWLLQHFSDTLKGLPESPEVLWTKTDMMHNPHITHIIIAKYNVFYSIF